MVQGTLSRTLALGEDPPGEAEGGGKGRDSGVVESTEGQAEKVLALSADEVKTALLLTN